MREDEGKLRKHYFCRVLPVSPALEWDFGISHESVPPFLIWFLACQRSACERKCTCVR